MTDPDPNSPALEQLGIRYMPSADLAADTNGRRAWGRSALVQDATHS
jgi:hypothetical protein